jgi:PAS fold
VPLDYGVRLRKDGEPVSVFLTISPVRDNQGRIIGASKIARDIRERKRFEEALEESEFSARLLQLQDEDRRRIARELQVKSRFPSSPSRHAKGFAYLQESCTRSVTAAESACRSYSFGAYGKLLA